MGRHNARRKILRKEGFAKEMMNRFLTNKIIVVSLLATTMLMPGAYAQQLSVGINLRQAQVQRQTDSQKRIAAERFLRTELFFGTDRADAPDVTEEEWQQFLSEEITRRFPEGLTVLTGYGQFLNSTGQIIRETSKLVILLYPESERKDKSNQIEQIRERYKELFQQQSVLRVDNPKALWVSF
jgi:hypothetical protein